MLLDRDSDTFLDNVTDVALEAAENGDGSLLAEAGQMVLRKLDSLRLKEEYFQKEYALEGQKRFQTKYYELKIIQTRKELWAKLTDCTQQWARWFHVWDKITDCEVDFLFKEKEIES